MLLGGDGPAEVVTVLATVTGKLVGEIRVGLGRARGAARPVRDQQVQDARLVVESSRLSADEG